MTKMAVRDDRLSEEERSAYEPAVKEASAIQEDVAAVEAGPVTEQAEAAGKKPKPAAENPMNTAASTREPEGKDESVSSPESGSVETEVVNRLVRASNSERWDMTTERVSCDLRGLLTCEAADAIRFVFSRYFVPLRLEFPASETPVLPDYKKAYIQELLSAGKIDVGRVQEIFDSGGMQDVAERNRLALAGGGEAEGMPDGRPDLEVSETEDDGPFGRLVEVTTKSRATGDLLRRVGEEVRSSLVGRRALEVEPIASAEPPLPSNANRRPRAQTDNDFNNYILGLLQSDLGYLFLDRTRIRPSGFRIGEHVFALSLAPAEEVTLEQKTFAKRQLTFEEQNEQEEQFDLELASTLTTELVEGFERAKSRNDTSGLSLSHTGQYSSPEFFWGKINASHTIGYTRNVTEASNETTRRSAKDSQSASSKVAAKYRTLHKTTFRVSEERGFESTSKRVIRNPNRYTPITLHYFKVLQRLELQQERYGVRLCWTPAVQDPAASFFQQLRVGKKKIIDDAAATIPQPPKEPVKPAPAGGSSAPVEERWLHSERIDADKWGFSGDQRHDYNVDIPYPSDFAWDGVVSSLLLVVETQRTDYSAEIRGIPISTSGEGGTVLRVVVHIGAGLWFNGPRIWFQVGARFVKPITTPPAGQSAEDAQYAAAVAQYATALKDWEDKRDAIMEAAGDAAAMWEADMLARLDPVTEMINQITRSIFPPSVRDEVWEIDLWQKLFDWEQATHIAYPGWWAEGSLRDPTREPNDFVNASWAKLFLPVRPGMERVALRWIFGKTIGIALDVDAEAAFDRLLDDLAAYRTEHFGDSQEISIHDGECPTIDDVYKCIAQWSDVMPTDGTHVEVLQGSTSAADDTTAHEADDQAAHRQALLEDLEAATELKKEAVKHISEPADVRIRIGLPSRGTED
jgi:hypothetical protein